MKPGSRNSELSLLCKDNLRIDTNLQSGILLFNGNLIAYLAPYDREEVQF